MIDGESENDKHGGTFGTPFAVSDALRDGFASLPNWKTKLSTRAAKTNRDRKYSKWILWCRSTSAVLTVTAKMPDLPNQHDGQSFCFWWFDPPVTHIEKQRNWMSNHDKQQKHGMNKSTVIYFYHLVKLSGRFFLRVVARSKDLGTFWKSHLLEELGDIPRCWGRGLG